MSYATTPILSVEAVQLKEIVFEVGLLVAKLVGAVGA